MFNDRRPRCVWGFTVGDRFHRLLTSQNIHQLMTFCSLPPPPCKELVALCCSRIGKHPVVLSFFFPPSPPPPPPPPPSPPAISALSSTRIPLGVPPHPPPHLPPPRPHHPPPPPPPPQTHPPHPAPHSAGRSASGQCWGVRPPQSRAAFCFFSVRSSADGSYSILPGVWGPNFFPRISPPRRRSSLAISSFFRPLKSASGVPPRNALDWGRGRSRDPRASGA